MAKLSSDEERVIALKEHQSKLDVEAAKRMMLLSLGRFLDTATKLGLLGLKLAEDELKKKAGR